MKPPWEFEEPACAEVGTTIFFQPDKDDPEYRGTNIGREYEYARKVCETCPHQMECAEWGIANETHGMWGGLSPSDRNKIRSNRRLPITPKVNISYN